MEGQKFYYVYILENQNDKTWYTGFTGNLKKRTYDHISGNGCITTSRKTNWKLIYFEGYLNKKDALGREKFLKSGSGKKYIRKQLYHYFNIQYEPNKRNQ